ncbi:isoprenyl transferase [Facklamia sp. DSM 111018]|uniref:Isoprenyl transferase n=1 Tax=Facklamia lactis TaxID=2749967 RepID=A0ABS0LMV4_9LACT|nr:isoprenyl transferase [Facklamia lactis]MBG9985292.1 isoprenyl transferase [Facklamia lactis]
MNHDLEKIPKHVAIIMDGNGRWAKKRMMPRVFGHRKGVETLKEIVIRANELGIKILTVYAFSTENWSRPEDEVNFLLNLPKDFFDSFLPQLNKNNVKVDYIGDANRLPEETQAIMQEGLAQTSKNTGMILNIALNYGSRQEITQAVQLIATKVAQGELMPNAIDEELIDAHLMTHFLGEYSAPDLMIRTSGELRLSNFLLWQLAYSEFYFTDILWPDFKPEQFDEAIIEYSKRKRRFGKV